MPQVVMELGRLRRQVDRLRALPTFDTTIARIVAALDRPDGGHAVAAVLIERDQVLTAQLLRLANSAFYGLSGRVGSVLQALTVLGTIVSRSLVCCTAALDRHALPGLWEHSMGTAAAAGAIARQLRLPEPQEISAAGLLHDLGKVVLFRQAPEAFAAVEGRARARGCRFLEAEHALLGTDHAEIAGWLLPRWRLPPRMVDAVAWHHDPGRASEGKMEAVVVHLANTVVHALGIGFGGDDRVPPIDPTVPELLGLSAADTETLLVHAVRALRGATQASATAPGA